MQTAAQTPTLAPPVPADTAVNMPKASAPVEPSPVHAPLASPPGAQPDGTVAAPELLSTPTPETEASPLPPEPFADELPPDFWGDELEPPTSSAQPFAAPTDELSAPPSPAGAPPASSSSTARPLDGSLQDDPRFKLLQELFPGRISDWQSASVDAATAGKADDDGADDAPGDPETVDLEAGLDADETAGDAN